MGEFLLITSNNKLAYEALAHVGGELDLHSVVVALVPNEPGGLAPIARVLADNGINVSQVFATSVDGNDTVMVVLDRGVRDRRRGAAREAVDRQSRSSADELRRCLPQLVGEHVQQ